MNAGVGEYSDIEKYYKLSSTKIWIEEEDEYKNYIYENAGEQRKRMTQKKKPPP